MAWCGAWERVMCAAGIADGMELGALATNPNVAPTMACARAIWRDGGLRAPLLSTWEAAGLDAALLGSAVHVAHDATFTEWRGWLLVDVLVERFDVTPGDVVAGVAQHASLLAETALALGAMRAFSRNARVRHADLALDGFDALGLARNHALAPEALLADRRRGVAGYYAELSTHPRLTIGDVLAHRTAPWCWYMLSRAPNVTTPAVYCAYRAQLPFSRSGIAVNPSFDDAARDDAGVSRAWSCALHGHACMYCTVARGECGAPLLSRLPDAVSWDVYLRLTDDLAGAMQRAHDRGVFVAAGYTARAVGAYSGALGNGALTLGQAAWCVAHLRALGKMGAWMRITLAANAMRAARSGAEVARTQERARVAAIAPSVVQVLRARGVPVAFARHILALVARPVEAYSVLRRSGDRALVHFECGLRADAASIWLPVTDPFAR
jgi:hypothetical protein